jgi:hypothetical protein
MLVHPHAVEVVLARPAAARGVSAAPSGLELKKRSSSTASPLRGTRKSNPAASAPRPARRREAELGARSGRRSLAPGPPAARAHRVRRAAGAGRPHPSCGSLAGGSPRRTPRPPPPGPPPVKAGASARASRCSEEASALRGGPGRGRRRCPPCRAARLVLERGGALLCSGVATHGALLHGLHLVAAVLHASVHGGLLHQVARTGLGRLDGPPSSSSEYPPAAAATMDDAVLVHALELLDEMTKRRESMVRLPSCSGGWSYLFVFFLQTLSHLG